ncbi:MAG: putative toxin-antitoxin system toxin component, PIN family [Lachnospiraceae bacterium]|nr:putative toxin-antitoxin system toxin component, PIN family [Lachnospiraceae bacterium]
MKVMLDTNIIISAALFPRGKTAQAFYKTLSGAYQPVMCDYIVDELHRKFREKFPERLTELEAFLFHVLQYVHLVPTPDSESEMEGLIRDLKDRPILRAAISAHVDLLLTGDKDFLESSVTSPRIVSVSEFLDM